MRRFPATLIACALLASPLPAQNNPGAHARPKPPPPPPRTGSLAGTVFCGDTHKPARGAMVMVTPVPGPDSAANDAESSAGRGSEAMTRVATDGSFTAPHLAAGEYAVVVMLPGYLSQFDTILQQGMLDRSSDKMRELLRKAGTINVSATGTTHTELTLERGAAVSGRVLYADGSPAIQITIDIQNTARPPAKPASADEPDELMMVNMMRSMFTHQSQSTDDQGRFRVAGLPPGKYRVAAVQPAVAPSGSGDEMGYLSLMLGSGRATDLHVYSGDTLHRKDAKVYELRSGDEITGIDITLPIEAFHRVSGRLAATDGRAVNSARLLLTDTADDTLVFAAEPAPDGTFVFATVPAGTYTLSSTAARIMVIPDGMPDGLGVPRFGKVAAAFADGSTSVIVKESDVPEVHLPLTEIPVPPGTNDNMPNIPVPTPVPQD